MRRIFYIALTAFAIILATGCSFDSIPYTKSGMVHIVTVGLDYANTDISDLNGTVNDALEIAAAFESIYKANGIPYETVRLIQEGPDAGELDRYYPSSKNIMETIDSLVVYPDDLIIFFYSGHGDVFTGVEGIEDGEAFFATGATEEEGSYGRLRALDVYEALDDKGCPVVAIIDACYSGGMATVDTKGRSFTESIAGFGSGMDLRNVQVLAASQEDELSYTSSTTTEEGIREAHSAFTIAILNQLGWRHSIVRLYETVYVSGTQRNIMGYLRTVPKSLTATELFSSVMASWYDSRQTPKCNNPGAAEIRICP